MYQYLVPGFSVISLHLRYFFYLVKSLVKIIWSCSCINNFFFTVLQVIFTFLQISQSHYHLIRGKGKVDKTSKATISYTRPYDYMDARDRTEILEVFFWFGQVQSNPREFTWRPCSIFHITVVNLCTKISMKTISRVSWVIIFYNERRFINFSNFE